jgi:large subunit ribosomal protein L15e
MLINITYEFGFMVKGLYQQVARMWKKPKESLGLEMKSRLIKWRRENTVRRIEKPTRVDRARAIGYKAKSGYVIVRVKIGKGGRRRELYGRRGRKPTKMGLIHFSHGKSLQKIAEEKAQRKYINMFVLGSYLVGDDGNSKWYEVALADPQHGNVRKNPKLGWMSSPANRKRALR